MEYFKTKSMEDRNAFSKFVINYSDKDLMETINSPDETDFSVYNAVLEEARKRGLISDEEFADNSQTGEDAESLSPELLEAEKNKFWKCPECHEIVDMEYVICWNCQKEQPINAEHPTVEETINEIKKINTFNPVKSGFGIILTGVVVILLEYFLFSGTNGHLHLYRLIGASFIILAGLSFVIYGLFIGNNKES
jgi:hypothetical protein